MQFYDAKTVREIVIEMPGATRVFEKMGIDYCCGGAKPITEACQTAGVTVEEVVRSLEQFMTSSQASAESKDWQAESLASLITHIHDKHHVFTREELDRIEPLLAKVCSVYSEKRPELLQIQALFEELKRELLLHMKKEENILFPYITQMETAISADLAAPVAMFGTVRNPVRMMMNEHDGAGDVLRRIRQLSNDFNPPADACVSYQSLYRAMEELEQDLHQHIHLENNILFPRAIEMEG
jgi:regulator of cell morphogenesis and NO signaling